MAARCEALSAGAASERHAAPASRHRLSCPLGRLERTLALRHRRGRSATGRDPRLLRGVQRASACAPSSREEPGFTRASSLPASRTRLPSSRSSPTGRPPRPWPRTALHAGDDRVFGRHRDPHLMARGARGGHRRRLGVDPRPCARRSDPRHAPRLEAHRLFVHRLPGGRMRNAELERQGWEKRRAPASVIVQR